MPVLANVIRNVSQSYEENATLPLSSTCKLKLFLNEEKFFWGDGG